MVVKHVLKEVNSAEAGSFRTDERASERKSLSGEHAVVLAGKLLVHSLEITDLAAAYSDVTCRNVHVRTYVSPELKHEGLAETHDLSVGLALRVEVGTTLSATHRQGCEGVFEYLLKSEEFEYGRVHRRVEAETALIWTDGIVELDPVAGIGLNLTVVVNPGDAECEDSVRLHEPLNNLGVFKLRMLVVNILNRLKHFTYGLEIFLLRSVLGLKFGHDFFCSHFFDYLF